MRQLLVRVPRGCGKEALQIAEAHRGVNLALAQANDSSGLVDLVQMDVSNARIEDLLLDLEKIRDLHVTLAPQGVIVLHPPASAVAKQVRNVEHLSPIEIYLAGLQSIGSWRGFLGYAAAAGTIVWIGMFTNAVYLLIGAMLIAPFAGPAMNASLATARGDLELFGRTLARYGASLAVGVAVAFVLSLLFRQRIATPQMVSSSRISIAAVLLPLVAGAAGALHESQSSRTSLVSGAAVGMLVAASLAPPAGLIGMAAAVERWDMIKSGLFLLLLQLAGINLAGAAVFRLYGVSPTGNRFAGGRRGVFPMIVAAAVLLLGGLLAWQLSSPPNLQRSSRSERATAVIKAVVNQSGLARLVSSNVRFTRSNVAGQNTLLAVVYVQGRGSATPSSTVRSRLTYRIQMRLQRQGFNLVPLVDVIVMQPPPQGTGG